MACALIAQQIASAGTTDRDIAYTAGILHGIGLLALAVVRPNEYVHLLGTYIGNSSGILDRERLLFGIDHCELGKKLVSDWNLPEDFEAVMFAPHTENRSPQWSVPEIVGLSCHMADTVGFSAFPACHPAPFEELLAKLPARELKLFHTDAELLAFEVSKKIAVLESI
jgi:HD-like signal output (HDOD) protein